ncbi:helix-turn-helix domain-containing protein, partial [Parasutterella sp.]|uniref:helix-turn-helix domain-containing protein n=1 Tax=Parasutterella sp. TaxID=2049037 RepID=UPI003AB789C1
MTDNALILICFSSKDQLDKRILVINLISSHTYDRKYIIAFNASISIKMTQEKLVRLRYFLAFAELGLLSAVAARFDVNESSVSRTLKAFEKEIGRTLFAQQGRRLALTTEG